MFRTIDVEFSRPTPKTNNVLGYKIHVGLSTFTSTTNGRKFDIKEFILCNSTHVVYALQCPCGLMYLGQTKKKWLNEYL